MANWEGLKPGERVNGYISNSANIQTFYIQDINDEAIVIKNIDNGFQYMRNKDKVEFNSDLATPSEMNEELLAGGDV